MATSNTAIKITSLPNIGNNIAPTTLIPVVNMAGVPTTQKANLQIAGNLILAGAGGANFVPAALANLAYTVVNSNQSNITRVGTLNISTFKVSGGTNGQYLQTDGTGNLSWTTGSGGGGNGTPGGSNTQIQFNDSGAFGGNVGFAFNKITGIFTSPFLAGNGNGLSNIQVANVNGLGNIATVALNGNGSQVLLGNGTWDSKNSSYIVNGSSNVNIATANGNVTLSANNSTWTFSNNSTLVFPLVNSQTYIQEQRYGMGNLVGYLDGGWVIGEYNGTSYGTEGIRISPGIEGNIEVNLPSDANAATNSLQLNNYANGNVSIQSYNYNWNFSNDGNLILPNGSLGNTYGDDGVSLQAPQNSYAGLNSYNQQQWIEVDDVNAYVGVGYGTSNAAQWMFSQDGNLTLPSNTSSINYANGQPYGGGGAGVSLVPNDVTYGTGSLYGYSNPGFTVVNTGDDDQSYNIPVDFPLEFLGNSYSSGSVWLVSNSYLTFGPDGADYTAYHPVGPIQIPVPAIFVGSADLSNQKYYYGYANGTDIFVIGYEGSIETSGEANYPAMKWELQVSAATPNQITIIVDGASNNGGSLNFPAGIWGISDGSEWVDQYQPLPWYSNNNDNTYNAITIAPVTPVAVSTIAFTGPGVTYSENGGTTFININPFDDAISVGYDDNNSEAIISSTYYGLKLTTARDGEDLTLAPLGSLYMSAGNASDNQPGSGQRVYINGGDARDNPNNTGQNYDGGNIEISGGSAVNAGTPGSIKLRSNNNTWTFDSSGNLYAPGSGVFNGQNLYIGEGANSLTQFNASTLVISANDTAYIQAVVTNVSDVGSADWVAYGHRGDDTGGWVDMGFTSSGFSDANYTITGQGDGYVFAQSFYDGQSPGGRGGNLVLATGVNGTVNDIVFATNGFLAENEFGRISSANNELQFTSGGSLTGANVISANTFLGTGNLILQPDPNNSGAYLNVYLTTGPDIHIAGNGENLILGSDEFATVNVNANSTISMKTPNGIPNNVTAITGSSGSWESNPSTDLATTGGTGTGLTVTVSQSGGYAGTITIVNPGSGYSNGDAISVVSGSSSASFTISVVNNQWTLDTTGKLTLPTIPLGSGIDERTVISSQRKIIPPFRWSAEITGTTPTVVYTATDNSITSMKVTFQVQHTGLGFEMFDVYATVTGSTYYTVSNRLQPPTIDNTSVLVDLNGSNEMQITLTVNSGAATCWVTYDATEFGISVD